MRKKVLLSVFASILLVVLVSSVAASPTLVKVIEFSGSWSMEGLAIDQDNEDIYITTVSAGVQRFSKDGHWIQEYSGVSRGAVFGPDGNLYSASSSSVYRINTVTGVKSQVAWGMWSIQGMAFDSDGFLWVVAAADYQIWKVNIYGSNDRLLYASNVGSSSEGWPRGLAVDGSNLYVVTTPSWPPAPGSVDSRVWRISLADPNVRSIVATRPGTFDYSSQGLVFDPRTPQTLLWTGAWQVDSSGSWVDDSSGIWKIDLSPPTPTLTEFLEVPQKLYLMHLAFYHDQLYVGGYDYAPTPAVGRIFKVVEAVDSSPPTTTDDAPLTWQNTDFAVMLACTDNGGSGCKETKYSIDSGAWQTGNSISISTEGDHLIEYYSIDNADNEESTRSTHAKLDKTAPTVAATADRDTDSNGWYNHAVTISFLGTDTTSGIASCDLPITYSGPDGQAIPLTGHCTDNAGNEGTGTLTINYDATPPIVTPPEDQLAEAVSPDGALVDYPPATATDNIGVTIGPACLPASGSVFPLGSTTVTCTASDGAGNVVSASFTVTVQDTTPPELTLPSPITAEATGPSGAVVDFTVTASDSVDGAVSVTCTPVSPSTFGLGLTTVSCSATDSHSNTGTGSFTVTVQDTTAPEATIVSAIDGDGDLVTNDGSTLSTSITFTFAGTDAVGVTAFECSLDDPSFTSCASPMIFSGLATGVHAFQVRAIDGAGNIGTASFTWTILTPADATGDLISDIIVMELPSGTETSLTSKLDNAIQSLEDGQENAAVNKLEAFINQVEAQRGKKLTDAQADYLIQHAQAIIDRIDS